MNGELSNLISEFEKISDAAAKTFGNLTAEQINWKPGADGWSVEQYFPFIEKALMNGYKPSFWSKIPFVSGIFGNLLLKAVNPENRKKFKAPKTFNPGESAIGGDVVVDFTKNQNKLLGFLEASKNLEAAKIKISWAASNLVTFSLLDAYKILLTHERRHFIQAGKVLQAEGFPK